MANILYSLKSLHSSEADVTHLKASTCQMDLRLIREEKPKSSPSPDGENCFFPSVAQKKSPSQGKSSVFVKLCNRFEAQ